MPTEPATPRQRDVLRLIETFVARHGYAPTERELAERLGLASKTAVRKHLVALAAAGLLEWAPGARRSLRLTGETRLSLPILGRVAAGAPIGPAREYDENLPIDPALFHPRPDYFLRVRGHSMRDDGILDGDLVAVQQTPTAESGQTVVARLDGEVTIKRLEIRARGIRLLPRNPSYQPIVVPRDAAFAIEGVYCGLVRLAR